MLHEHALADRWRAVLARSHLPMDDACAAWLARLIEDALHRIVADGDRPEALLEAEFQLQRLVDDMTQQARILRLDGLHAPNLQSALERLCPLWPFC